MGVPSYYTKVASATISKEGVVGDIWTSIGDVPPGTIGVVQLSGLLLGPAFDVAGVEQVVQSVFDSLGIDATVQDCYGEGWNTGYIRFIGSPFALVPFLYALAAVVGALAILGVVVSLTVFTYQFGKEPGKFTWPFIVIGVLVIAGLYVAGLSGKGKK